MRTWMLLSIGCLAALGGFVRADEDAKAVFERGTALFALHRFSDAAVAYEKAFELRADPAILYNAAQAHRLAGNKSRALELYESLVRLYGDKVPKNVEVKEHIVALRRAIEADRHVASAPPQTPLPSTGATAAGPHVSAKAPSPSPRPSVSPAAPATVTTSTPANAHQPAANVLTATGQAPAHTEPITKRRWFWGVVAAVVVVSVGLGVGLGLGIGNSSPTPTYGVGMVH